MISRGAQGGGAPLVKVSAGLAFQSLLALLPKCYDQMCTAIWLLRHFLLVTILYHFKTKLSCFHLWKYGRGCSWATPKLWAWLCVEPPLLKFLEITTAYSASESSGVAEACVSG